MTVVPIAAETPRLEPYDRDMLVCGDWPVPQLGIKVYALIARARGGDTVATLARDFGISELEAVLLCLHHRVGPKAGAKYFAHAVWRGQVPRRSFVELSQPGEAP